MPRARPGSGRRSRAWAGVRRVLAESAVRGAAINMWVALTPGGTLLRRRKLACWGLPGGPPLRPPPCTRAALADPCGASGTQNVRRVEASCEHVAVAPVCPVRTGVKQSPIAVADASTIALDSSDNGTVATVTLPPLRPPHVRSVVTSASLCLAPGPGDLPGPCRHADAGPRQRHQGHPLAVAPHNGIWRGARPAPAPRARARTRSRGALPAVTVRWAQVLVFSTTTTPHSAVWLLGEPDARRCSAEIRLFVLDREATHDA